MLGKEAVVVGEQGIRSFPVSPSSWPPHPPAGGALSRGGGATSKTELVKVPPPSMGTEMAQLLSSGTGTDFTFVVEDEEFKVGAYGRAVGWRSVASQKIPAHCAPRPADRSAAWNLCRHLM